MPPKNICINGRGEITLRIDLFNFEEFIDINKLQEVTSAVLFQRGDVPHPNGLISNEIFGITTRSRKETFAYINLHNNFFHPHIYKVLRRLFRNIDKIVNGESYYSINEDGYLVLDETNGDTGIDFLYDNWDKINWKYADKTGMRNERIDLITKTPKNKIFIKSMLVIPAFYRDIKPNQNGGGETDDINQMYGKLIRESTLIRDRDMFDIQFHNTNFSIQNTLVDIYNYFKTKIEKKNGLIRKYLMGKNVDYCTRVVITAPNFHADRPEELITDMRHAAIPISHICSLCFPFIMRWVKIFFEREVLDSQASKILYDPVTGESIGTMELDSPETYFTEKYYKKMIDSFIKDPESRFNKIEIPVKGGQKKYLAFTGKHVDTSNTADISPLASRPMTWTDLLYMAAEDVVKDKHCLITRYPLLDEFGIYVGKIRVLSTTKTTVMRVNDTIYKWYPVVDLEIPTEQIGSSFIDSIQFSNSCLPGLDGDYDGDQITAKIAFTQEANAEMEAYMNSKSYFINASGQNIRYVESEAIQTFYTMTKEPPKGSRILPKEEKMKFVRLNPKDITFEKLVDWFGDLANEEENKIKEHKSKYNMTDKITLSHEEYPLVEGTIQTTLGRLMYTKIIVEGCGLEKVLGYVNFVINDGGNGKIENAVTEALIDDKITTDQMYDFVDTRDWLGMQLHGVITTSFTLNSIKVPAEVKKLKKELITKYKKELEAGDPVISEMIEKTLVKKATEVLKDDIGMDLYVSGARGSIGNNYKNNNLYRGAIYNNLTEKYDIVTNSLMDGLDKKDIAAHSNTIVTGAYPKAVGTQVSGSLAKSLLAAMQSEVLGDKDSDCGTKGYIKIKIPQKKFSDFLYRYIIEGSKLVMLTDENIRKYIGKEVKLRSPMYCIGVGPEKCVCNKCAGDFYYKIGKKNIGLLCSRPAETTKRLSMKKFHSNLIENFTINVDDMLL